MESVNEDIHRLSNELIQLTANEKSSSTVASEMISEITKRIPESLRARLMS
jgi:hypothetical protein